MAKGFDHPNHRELPNLDKRRDAAAGKVVPAAATKTSAKGKLRGQVPTVEVEFDEITETPKWVGSTREFLTGPRGEGKAVPKAAMRAFPEGDKHRAIKAFLNEHSALFGHGAEALENARLERDFTAQHNKLRTQIWHQHLDGIDVFGGVLVANTARDGELVNLSSQFVARPGEAANRGNPNRAAAQAKPKIHARKAVAIAAQNIEAPIEETEVSDVDVAPAGPEKKQRFKAGQLPSEAEARLVWLPMSADQLQLCWEVELFRPIGGEKYRVLIDAQSGEVLVRHCLTLYLTEATYRVFTSDSPAPMTPGHPFPSTNQAPLVERELVTLAALSTNASPIGWISPGDNETRGNNAAAHLDRNADNQPDLPRPHGSPHHVFDFPMDLTKDASTYGDAAVVQLFYWCNWMHDTLYELGFTEAAGNFQKDNFGRGGLANDAVVADAQDGSGVNNANYTQARDGIAPRIQMYVFDGPAPTRDGDLDAEIIIHEYTHGLTDRLIGGGIGIFAIQTIGLAEGWSDFYSLALLSEPGDDLHGTYPVGGYTTWQFSGLTENYYFGIRRYPYSTDLTKNPLTFKDIDPAQALPHEGVPLTPRMRFDPKRAGDVHRQGEVWCSALWEVRAGLITKYGFEPGNRLTLQLITDALKLTPPNPTFTQARDAIFQADLVNNGGVNHPELWIAFAKRGLGLGAGSPPNWTTAGVAESFQTPDALVVLPISPVLFSGVAGGPLLPACRFLVLSNGSATNIDWAVNGTAGWLNIRPTNGTLAAGAATQVALCLNELTFTLPVGTHGVPINFTNRGSGWVVRRTAQLTVSGTASMPFADDFESGRLESYWRVSGTGPFQTQVTTNHVAQSGLHHVVMQAGSQGYASRNELTLTLDLEGYTNVVLRFWAKGLNGEPNGPPALPFTDGADFDGVAVSDDGVRWFEVRGLRSLESHYSDVVVDLDAAVAQHGLHYNRAFRIRFNQYGSAPAPDDGIALDDILVTGVAPRRFVVMLPPTVVEGDGLLQNHGAVRVPVPQEHDLAVQLRSSDPTAVLVPPVVTIRAGLLGVLFDLTVVDDALLDGTQSALITASAPNYIAGEGVIQIHDNETTILSLSIPASTREGEGVLSHRGLVAVADPPSADILVRLTSSAPTELHVPASVLLPAGQTHVTFDLTVVDDIRIDGAQTVTVTAAVDNWTGDSDTITVEDNEAGYLTLRVPEFLVEENRTWVGAGRLHLPGVLPTNLVATLRSSDPSRLNVPNSVSVAAGQTSVPFTLTLSDNSEADGTHDVILTASAGGFLSSLATVRLHDSERPPLAYDPLPPDQSMNQAVHVELSWRLGFEEPFVNGDFETGDFVGWSQESTGGGEWVIDDGSSSRPGSKAPFAGRFSAWCRQDSAGRNTLIQELALPIQIDGATLNWRDLIENEAPDFSSNQFFRVEILGVDHSLLAVAFATKPGNPNRSGWTERSFDLTPWRGQKVRIAFVEEDSSGFLNVHLDNVRVMVRSPGTPASEVYFGTNPVPGVSEFLGVTTNLSWRLPELESDQIYYWQIVTRRGSERSGGPIWRFQTRLFGPIDHFEWEPIASPKRFGEPFLVTVTAKDDSGQTVRDFSALAGLQATRTVRRQPVQVLTLAPFGDLRFYRGPLGGISAHFTNYVESLSTVTEPNTLRNALTGKDVLLVVPQNLVTRQQWRQLAASLRPVLEDFVSNGGILIVCAYSGEEHVLLQESGLLTLAKLSQEKVQELSRAIDHPLTTGLPESFDGYFTANYAAVDGMPVIQNKLGDAVVAVRPVGNGQVVMIGTDFSTNRTQLDRVIANAVQLGSASESVPVPFLPTVSGYFRDGRWQGPILLFGTGQDVVLHAEDGEGHRGSSNPFQVYALNDLALEIASPAGPVIVDRELSQTVTVSNSGPAEANSVLLKGAFAAGSDVISVSASQGQCLWAGNTFQCSLGLLAGNGVATVIVTILPRETGIQTNSLQVTGSAEEAHTENNAASSRITVVPPSISISSTAVTEGATAVLALNLASARSRTVSVDYFATNGTAIAGIDFVPVSGTLVFQPGETAKTISIPTIDDALNEPSEGFVINLRNPINAILEKIQTTVALFDNDPAPSLSISDASVVEGHRGTAAEARFRVTLSWPSGQGISVRYSTGGGTASAGQDYPAVSGTLHLPGGAMEGEIVVPVHGDDLAEEDETFFVNLTQPVNATLSRSQGSGLILDDDARRLDHFTIDPVPSPQELGQPFTVRVSARDGFGQVVGDFDGTVAMDVYRDREEVSVGSGGTTWEYPMGAYYHDSRLQTLYLSEEIGRAGRITDVALYVTSPPGQPLRRWTIRMKHAPQDRFEAARWETDGWTSVYQNDEPVQGSGWKVFHLQRPFDFNGVENLLVDFSFNNDFYSSDGLCRFSDTKDLRSVSYRTDSAFGDPLDWNSDNAPSPILSSRVPNVRFSLETPISVAPVQTTPFSSGTWEGSIAVFEVVENIRLRADDGSGHFGETEPFSVLAANDVFLQLAEPPSSANMGERVEFSMVIGNTGPATATGVVVTNAIASQLRLDSASTPRGPCAVQGQMVTCQIGTLAADEQVAITIATTAIASGPGTNFFNLGRNGTDAYSNNNQAAAALTIVPASLFIDNVSVIEGNSGTTNAFFTVRLSTAVNEIVSVNYDTVTTSGTATAGTDYLPGTGTLYFTPGVTTQQLVVVVKGDAINEGAETFLVRLSDAKNAVIGRGQATGTILNDDPLPALRIGDMSVIEGDAGITVAQFDVTLSALSEQLVFFSYTTSNGTALGGDDFQIRSSFSAIPAGLTNGTVTVNVLGDITVEPDETFFVSLSAPVNATIERATGRATILNDDGLPGSLHHFEWSAVPSPQPLNQPFTVRLTAKDFFGQTINTFSGPVTVEGRVGGPNVAIGGSTASWKYPLASGYHDARTQVIYLTNEIGGARRILGLALDIALPPGQVLHGWTIRMKHTPLSRYSAAAWEGSGWTTVYRGDEIITANGWTTFLFQTPFDYNGTANLMVDFSFNNFLFTSDGVCRSTSTSQSRALTQQSDSQHGDPLAWSGSSAPFPLLSFSIPNVRLISGFPAPVSPMLLGNFTGGVWAGSMSVLEPVTNVVLFALAETGHSGTSNPFTVQLSNDSDGDGLPDDWELTHFGTTDFGPLDDPDEDGMTNLEEYLAGTDPRDSRSAIIITAVALDGHDVVITFATVPGKQYLVEWNSTPGQGQWSALGIEHLGTGGLIEVKDSGGAQAESRFYRVRVR